MKRRELAFDPNFEKEHELLSQEYSDTFDKKLLTITKKEPDSKDSLLALRCRVSFPIYEKINLVVCDVSFISLTKVIEPSLKLLSSKAEIISLIKPQFETQKINLKKGIVKDPLIHEQVCNDISNWFKKTIKAEVVGLVESPITGPKGNKEFLIYSILKKS